MGMREKLIELLWEYDQMRMMRMSIEECVDKLIANGVTIPVRCKDCAVPHNRFTGCPNLNGLIPPQDFFCAYGERRTDA